MLRTKKMKALVFMLLLLGFGVPVHAQNNGRWEFLGEANVDGRADHDNIVVTSRRGEFRAIQLRVLVAPIEFDRVVVHYGNGRAEPIEIRNRIPAGGMTRVIDLPGRERIISSVELWYARGSRRPGRPKVRLFGMH